MKRTLFLLLAFVTVAAVACGPKAARTSAPAFDAPPSPSFSVPMPPLPRTDPVPGTNEPVIVTPAPDLTTPNSSPTSPAPEAPPGGFPQ